MDDGGAGDTGGNGESSDGNGWNDENSGTLWGWLDSVVSGLEDIWQTLTNLPALIVEGIKGIFIPDTEYIDTAFQAFIDELAVKFNIDTTAFEGLFTDAEVVPDVYVDYNVPGVGNFNLKVFDASFLISGVEYFRPFIAAFLVLLLFLFHVKQLIGFFGYDAGVVTGRNDHISAAKSQQ